MTAPRRTIPSGLLVAIALVMVAVPTLSPMYGAEGSAGFCIFCGSLGGLDFALNLILFVPLGAAIWIASRKPWYAAAAGFVVSAIIEALQFRLVQGRDATAGDVIANTIGCLIGAVIALGFTRLRYTTGATAGRWAAAAAVVTCTLVMVSAVLLMPSPQRYEVSLQWTPIKAGEYPFRGTLYSLEVNGRSWQPGDLIAPTRAADSMRGRIDVRATLSTHAASSMRHAIIVRFANELEEPFQLGQRGSGILFRTSTNASRVRLRTLLMGIDNAFSTDPNTDSILIVEGTSRPEFMELRFTRGPETRRATLRRSIGLAWSMLLPWSMPVTARWWPVNAAWMAMLLVPVSFLSARSRPSPVSGVVRWPVGLVLGAIIAMPLVTRLSPLGLGEWLGVLTGIAAGVLLSRFSQHLTPTPDAVREAS